MELNQMWQRLEKHQPYADKAGYGPEWQAMCTERTTKTAAEAQAAADAVWDEACASDFDAAWEATAAAASRAAAAAQAAAAAVMAAERAVKWVKQAEKVA